MSCSMGGSMCGARSTPRSRRSVRRNSATSSLDERPLRSPRWLSPTERALLARRASHGSIPRLRVCSLRSAHAQSALFAIAATSMLLPVINAEGPI